MANVLRYLTGALSKRAKRRGNLAVGIGEENYGPSSTTGYYNGITPPDGGFVVYATGSNGNPKIFVANSEDDLPAIARTLGGGELTVLGSKNYITGLAHAWVIDNISNNTITDGLILDLNAKNPSSFIDNIPTVNMANTTALATYWNNSGEAVWNSNDTGIRRLFPNLPVFSMLKTTEGNSHIGIGSAPASVDQEYTYSVYVWIPSSNSAGMSGSPPYFRPQPANYLEVTLSYNGSTSWGTWPRDQWIRIEGTGITNSTTSGTVTSAYISCYLNTAGDKIYFTAPQFESKSSATDFVNGTRSQNTTIYDLSGKGNNGTLANGASYDSNTNSIVFDGTDDEITVPDNVELRLTTDMSFEFLVKANSSQNNPYPRLIDKSNWLVHLSQTSPFSIAQNVNTSSGLRQTAVGSAFSSDTWTHILTTYDGQVGKIYTNGKLVNTNSWGSVLGATTSGTIVTIGGDAGTSRQLNGSMAKTRVYNRALSESEVKQNYYGGPIVTEGLVFAVDPSNLVSYESGSTTTYSLTGSINGTLVNGVSYSPNYGGRWELDGINDYITFGTQNLVTDDFTVENWFSIPTPGVAKEHYLMNIGYNSLSSLLFTLDSNTGGTFGAAAYYRDAAGNVVNYGMGSGVTNKIYHSVLTRSGGTNIAYLNGVVINTFSNSTTLGANLNLQLGWAIPRNKSTAYMNGNIYASRIYNRYLTASEVLQNYNAQKARFGL